MYTYIDISIKYYRNTPRCIYSVKKIKKRNLGWFNVR